MLKNFFKADTIHKKVVPHLDIIFILRPTLFFSIWVMVSIGMYLANNIYIKHLIWNTEFYFNTVLFFIAIIPIIEMPAIIPILTTLVKSIIYVCKADNINNIIRV